MPNVHPDLICDLIDRYGFSEQAGTDQGGFLGQAVFELAKELQPKIAKNYCQRKQWYGGTRQDGVDAWRRFVSFFGAHDIDLNAALKVNVFAVKDWITQQNEPGVVAGSPAVAANKLLQSGFSFEAGDYE